MDDPRITPARTRQVPAALLSLALAAALLAGCGSATSSKATAEGGEGAPAHTPAQTAEAEVKPSNLEAGAKEREAAFERELAQRRREAAAGEATGGKHAARALTRAAATRAAATRAAATRAAANDPLRAATAAPARAMRAKTPPNNPRGASSREKKLRKPKRPASRG